LSEKNDRLQEVNEAAEAYREVQLATLEARERFVDAIVAAREAKATQQEIAEQCVIEPGNSHHLSRRRIAQFIKERES